MRPSSNVLGEIAQGLRASAVAGPQFPCFEVVLQAGHGGHSVAVTGLKGSEHQLVGFCMSRTAQDIMTREVVSVSADMELRDLAKLFLEKHITGAPVVDLWSKAIGVVSQTDLINYTLSRDDEMRVDLGFYQEARINDRQMPAGLQLADTPAGHVSDIMTPVVHAVSEEDSVERVAEVMTANHIHRVIVLRHGRLAGVISALDVLKTLVARQPC